MSSLCQQCRKLYEGPKCPTCHIYTPNPVQIRRACEKIRRQWPPERLWPQELHGEVEIPVVFEPTDHMVRRDAF